MKSIVLLMIMLHAGFGSCISNTLYQTTREYSHDSFDTSSYKTKSNSTAVIKYRGTISYTIYGKTCQSWSAQAPHTHTVGAADEHFPGETLIQVRNYCRALGKKKTVPWCYTLDPHTRWQYRLIPGLTPTVTRTSIWHIADEIRLFGFPIMVVTGTISNILSICTLTRPELLKNPITFLFIILAITDILSISG